jgi:hypothetical protein
MPLLHTAAKPSLVKVNTRVQNHKEALVVHAVPKCSCKPLLLGGQHHRSRCTDIDGSESGNLGIAQLAAGLHQKFLQALPTICPPLHHSLLAC